MKVENLIFKIKSKEILFIDDLNFEEGKVHFILGKNGAGKSSLLKVISGLERNYSGKITYNGKDLRNWEIASLAKNRAVLSQSNFNAFPIRVEELIMMGRYPFFQSNPSRKDNDIVDKAIDLFALENFVGRDFLSLSGGEQQRVLFAKCIAQIWGRDESPKFLFLDEPLTYLDVEYQVQFLSMLKKIISDFNITVIGVIHDINLALSYGDNFVLLSDGKCVKQGDAQHVLNSKTLQQFFNVSPKEINCGEKKYYIF